MIKKAVMIFVLFLLLSSILAFAQETDNTAEQCNLGCKIWQFFFGSKEARAGKAWFDRSEALVGKAPEESNNKEIEKKCDGGDSQSCFNAGKLYYNDREYTESFKWYKKACDKNDGRGCSNLAYQYLKGEGVNKDGSIALTYDNKGCALGAIKSCNNVKSIQDVFVAAGYTDKEENLEARKKLYESTFPEETGKYTGTEEQNVKLLNKLKSTENTKVPLKSGVAVSPPTSTAIDPKVQSQLQQSLGPSYSTFEKSIGKVTKTYPDKEGNLVMEGPGGTITVRKDENSGVQIAERAQGGKTLETSIVKNGHILAAQDEKGNVIVGETAYNFPKDKKLSDSLGELATGIQLPGKEGELGGLLKLEEDVFTAVDYEKETLQRTDTKSGETENLNIDYYKEGTSGCKTKGGCVIETGGEAAIIDAQGKMQRYLVDYDYDGTGADRKLEDKEYFNPLTGNQEGVEYKNAEGKFSKVIALKDSTTGKYSGEYSFTTDGTTATFKRVGDEWQSVGVLKAQADYDAAVKKSDAAIDGEARAVALTEVELKKAALEKAQEDEKKVLAGLNEDDKKLLSDNLNKVESSSQGDLASARGVFQSIYALTNNLRSYPAISNLLFGDTDFFKNWRAQQDAAFAPLLGENIWSSAICELGFNHWQDLEPEGKAIIKTPSGTYQTVASIQMERSPESSPILCHKNPDEESEELFICDGKQVCLDESFCYADQDQDNEPDSRESLKGYFYKVTWAVSAPQDETFTPLVDENGVAVSFNIFLYPGAVPMYNLNGNIASPIQLQNGARDKDAIIKYSTQVYDKACIVWNQAPLTAGSAGGVIGGALSFGIAEAREPVGEVCFNVVTSSVGQVNWERSGQEAASVTVSHGEVSRNTDW